MYHLDSKTAEAFETIQMLIFEDFSYETEFRVLSDARCFTRKKPNKK